MWAIHVCDYLEMDDAKGGRGTKCCVCTLSLAKPYQALWPAGDAPLVDTQGWECRLFVSVIILRWMSPRGEGRQSVVCTLSLAKPYQASWPAENAQLFYTQGWECRLFVSVIILRWMSPREEGEQSVVCTLSLAKQYQASWPAVDAQLVDTHGWVSDIRVCDYLELDVAKWGGGQSVMSTLSLSKPHQASWPAGGGPLVDTHGWECWKLVPVPVKK